MTPLENPMSVNPDVPNPGLDRPANPIHHALDWAHQQAAGLLAALSSIRLSKPAAEIAGVAETVLEAALPSALAAGEASLANLLTPEHLEAMATLVGEINAEIVRQFLARIPHAQRPS
jgi:hypothetical protein